MTEDAPLNPEAAFTPAPPGPVVLAQTNLQLYNQLVPLAWSDDDLRRARSAYDLAARLFSGRYRCSGKPFVAHLVGTASVVAGVDGRPDVVLAALLHAAYEQGDFGPGRRSTTAGRRSVVRSAVGAAAEGLVFAYAAAPWSADVVAAAIGDAGVVDAMRRNVLLLRLANEVDEHADLGVRYCDKGGKNLYQEEVLERMATLAQRLDSPALAATFRRVIDQERGVTVPVVLRSSDRGSTMHVPASYAPRFSVSARRVIGRGRKLATSLIDRATRRG